MTSSGHPFYLRSKGQTSRSARVCTLASASPPVTLVNGLYVIRECKILKKTNCPK